MPGLELASRPTSRWLAAVVELLAAPLMPVAPGATYQGATRKAEAAFERLSRDGSRP